MILRREQVVKLLTDTDSSTPPGTPPSGLATNDLRYMKIVLGQSYLARLVVNMHTLVFVCCVDATITGTFR